jgi:hypothetical protein
VAGLALSAGSVSATNILGTISNANLSTDVALLSSGKLPAANLPTNVAFLDSHQTFTGDNTIKTIGVIPLRITDGNRGNIVVQTLRDDNSGFQVINFNGFYAQSEVIYNTKKTRWRIGVDQRGSVDDFFIDSLARGISFRILTNGNVEIPLGGLTVGGPVSATAFNQTSDREAKENFTSLDGREVLEKVASLPISCWNFKGDQGAKHVGPMAQDFHAAFGLGADERRIATVDADGVALAAIQGLNQKLTEELKRRDAENAELKQRLSNIEQLIRQLTEKK